MKMVSKEGQTLVDVKSIQRDGRDLVMKAKLMDAYSMPIVVTPQAVRDGLKLLSWKVFWYLPLMLVRGIGDARAAGKQADKKD
jgi:hypothetical protein